MAQPKPDGVYEHGFTRDEDAERKAKAAEAERMIASGHVKVNAKNHVKRKGKGEDNEDKEVAGALDELDGKGSYVVLPAP